ncbi:hypothetical protein ABZ725_14395 [Streptomyces sp. NPDC006872]|uniref:hypothetical protein n=1 Tax=Streptomyces sp. NPDC006872 TaxID=3155720 RepID=UPI0033E9A63C
MAHRPCWNCRQPATHTLTRDGSIPLDACDNCTRIDREQAERQGWTITPIKPETAQPKPLAVDQEVEFDDGQGNTLTGVITLVWDKPKVDPYVTVVTSFEDQPRKFVRMSSRVQRTAHASTNGAPLPDCTAVQHGDRSLCSCMDCIEYTADQDGEYGC